MNEARIRKRQRNWAARQIGRTMNGKRIYGYTAADLPAGMYRFFTDRGCTVGFVQAAPTDPEELRA